LHIKRHCEAIRKFCTKWPENLTDEIMEDQFPLTISYSDYVHQGTSLRDMRARIITMKLKLSALKLDDLSKDKLIRLAGWRYSKQDGTLTIVTDRCYTRKQNLDYANYLLTALYHESQKREEWEVLKERVDNRYVEFTGSQCEEKLLDIMQKIAKAEVKDGSTLPIPPAVADLKDPEKQPVDKELDKETLLKHPTVEKFAATWSELRNQEETPALTRQYSDRVRQLLGIPALSDAKFENLHRRSPAMQSSKIPDEFYEQEAKKKFRRNY